MHNTPASPAENTQKREIFENQVSTKTRDTLLNLLKRLPRIWGDRRRARRIVPTLPEYDGAVEMPDSDTIYAWLEELCATPHRRPGTPEGHRAEQWIAERLSAFGLENVTLDPIPITVWTAQTWSLTIDGWSVPCFYVPNTAFTGPEGRTAPLAYVGKGSPRQFAQAQVAGKIVVADVPFPRLPTGLLMKGLRACYALSDPDHSVTLRTSQYLNFVRQNFLGGADGEQAPEHDVYWQAVRQGAAGICLILQDQPSNANTHYGPYDGIMKPLPGLWIGKHDGVRLREQAKRGATATLTLEGRSEAGTTYNVWAVLPGRSEEIIFITSHHDSPFQGAVEDGTGVVEVLAQVRAWTRVPRQDRPRTLVFILDAGHFYGSIGADTFARQHRDLLERARILITLEHLAAKEVEADGDAYAETGRLAFTVMFTTPDPAIISTALRALERRPAKVTASIPADFFGPGPTSDAMGYVLETGVPVISWIGCPYYLLDEHDTLDKVQKDELAPIAETVAELVKIHMARP